MKFKIFTMLLLFVALTCAADKIYTLNEQWVNCGNGVKLTN